MHNCISTINVDDKIPNIHKVFWVKIGQFCRFRLFNARKWGKKNEFSAIIARVSALTPFSQAP